MTAEGQALGYCELRGNSLFHVGKSLRFLVCSIHVRDLDDSLTLRLLWTDSVKTICQTVVDGFHLSFRSCLVILVGQKLMISRGTWHD